MAREKRNPLELRPADLRYALKEYKRPFQCDHDWIGGLWIVDAKDKGVIHVGTTSSTNRYRPFEIAHARRLCALLNHLSEKAGLCE